MTSAESFERYGTITLGIDHMRQTIYVDRVLGSLECGNWIASVPEAYRSDVLAAAEPVAKQFVRRCKLTEGTVLAIIHAMHDAVIRIEPLPWGML